jgi:hypothetical protein
MNSGFACANTRTKLSTPNKAVTAAVPLRKEARFFISKDWRHECCSHEKTFKKRIYDKESSLRSSILCVTIAVCVTFSFSNVAFAQSTVTYHLHKEGNPDRPGLLQLNNGGPDAVAVALKSTDWKNIGIVGSTIFKHSRRRSGHLASVEKSPLGPCSRHRFGCESPATGAPSTRR